MAGLDRPCSPGNTYFTGGVWAQIENGNPALFPEAMRLNPTGRMGSPREVANAVAFLASPAASFINGTNLVADRALTRGVQLQRKVCATQRAELSGKSACGDAATRATRSVSLRIDIASQAAGSQDCSVWRTLDNFGCWRASTAQEDSCRGAIACRSNGPNPNSIKPDPPAWLWLTRRPTTR